MKAVKTTVVAVHSDDIVEFEEINMDGVKLRFTKKNLSNKKIKHLKTGDFIYIKHLRGITPCIVEKPQDIDVIRDYKFIESPNMINVSYSGERNEQKDISFSVPNDNKSIVSIHTENWLDVIEFNIPKEVAQRMAEKLLKISK